MNPYVFTNNFFIGYFYAIQYPLSLMNKVVVLQVVRKCPLWLCKSYFFEEELYYQFKLLLKIHLFLFQIIIIHYLVIHTIYKTCKPKCVYKLLLFFFKNSLLWEEKTYQFKYLYFLFSSSTFFLVLCFNLTIFNVFVWTLSFLLY